MHRATIPTTLTALLLLTGCGTDNPNPSGLPTIGTSTTTTGTATATPPQTSTKPSVDPSPWTALPTVDVGPNKGVHSGVVLASSIAKTDDEKAAVGALLAYWRYIAKAGYEVRVDEATLTTVAYRAAAEDIKSYVANLKQRNAKTVGWASLNVTRIIVGQNSVLITSCLDNGSFDVDARTGKRLEQGAVGFDSQAAVRSIDGSLLVTSWAATDRTKSCTKG